MKFLDKNKLYIIKSQDGIYTFEYNSDIIFDFSVYKNKKVINVITGEVFTYEELLFGLNKDNGYLYPEEFYRANKVIEDYHLANWFFEDDPRAVSAQKESLFAKIDLTIKNLAPHFVKFNSAMENFYAAGKEVISVGKEIQEEFFKLAPVDTSKFQFIVKK